MQVRQKPVSKKPETKEDGVSFTYGLNADAREVYLVGDFNNWDRKADPMIKKGGVFHKSLNLRPGEYQYKFLVDGKWQNDPSASTQVPNPFGSTNSLIKVRERR